jgi:ribonuclease PH
MEGSYTHLYLLQGKQCVRLLLRHTLHKTETRKQIQIDLAWIQQEAGTSAAILQDTQAKLAYLQDGWVVGIRRFLTAVDAEIIFHNT